jgi:uncharacterized membrane protein YkvA (DUF1232 family)
LPEVINIIIGLAIALVAAGLAFGAVVFAVRSPDQSFGEIARIVPDSVRLAAALYRDRTLPSSVRWRLRIALIYNIQPINLIPDAIPVIGFADNVVVLAWALRGAVRIAGPEVVGSHWNGSPTALVVLYRALRLSGPETGHDSFQPLRATRRIAIPVTSPIAVALDDDRRSA